MSASDIGAVIGAAIGGATAAFGGLHMREQKRKNSTNSHKGAETLAQGVYVALQKHTDILNGMVTQMNNHASQDVQLIAALERNTAAIEKVNQATDRNTGAVQDLRVAIAELKRR